MPPWRELLCPDCPLVLRLGGRSRQLSVVSKSPKLLPGSLSAVLQGNCFPRYSDMYLSTLGTVHTLASGLGCSLNSASRSSLVRQRLRCLERYADTDLGVTKVPSLFLTSSVGSKLTKSPDSESSRDSFTSNFLYFSWGCNASSRDLLDALLGVAEPPSSAEESLLAVRGRSTVITDLSPHSWTRLPGCGDDCLGVLSVSSHNASLSDLATGAGICL